MEFVVFALLASVAVNVFMIAHAIGLRRANIDLIDELNRLEAILY